MKDRTEDFRKAVKAMRKVHSMEKGSALQSHNLISRKKHTTAFSKNALELTKSITKLREFLLGHRIAYINSNHVQGSTVNVMTDYERDKIDEEAQNIIRISSAAIANLRQSVTQKGQPEQVVIHKQYVIDLIENHLKSVCKVYSEQKAIRVKLAVDRKRISRLHNPETHKKITQQPPPPDTANQSATASQKNHRPKQYINESEDELSETDVAAFEQENQLIFNDMNSMVDEVKAIEGKVIEIARLQEIFSEQVMKQEGDIDMISDKVLEGTENIKGGNEALREAIKNNAGFRVWILFFLVMCSFSLLFLEWYS